MPQTTQNLLVESIVEAQLRRAAEKYARGRLVDIGCGHKPYAHVFAPYVSQHVGVDYDGSLHGLSRTDRVGSAYEVPSDDCEFDTVLCTSVLEHLEEPERALREARRILKPGGIAIYTVPFIWHLHEEPRDFFRFSKYGLAYLLKKTGFDVVELHPLSGFWVTFGQLLVYNIYRLNQGAVRRLRLLTPIGLGIQGIAWALDKVDRSEKWTWMYLVVARRGVS